MGVILAFTGCIDSCGRGDLPSEIPEPILRARWSEDWAVLCDPTPLDAEATWFPPNYTPFGKSGGSSL